MRRQTAEGRPASAALLAASVSLVTVAAFLFTMGGPPTRGWVPQAQDASPSGSDVSSNVQLKPDADDEASRRSTNRPFRTGHPTDHPTADSESPAHVAEKSEPVAPKVSSVETIVGQSVEGRPLVCRTIGDGEYVVLMLASIHGNEAAGTPLLNHLAEHGKRYNTRCVDLNRNFPAENRQNSTRYGLNALSEPEALAIYQVINDTLPNHIVTLHEPLQCVDYDGPAKALATVMSEFCPLPVKKLGSRPGSLGSYAGVTLGIPTITFELPHNAATQPPELLWRFYGEALIQAVLHRHESSE